VKRNHFLIISIIVIIFSLLGSFRMIHISSIQEFDISSYIKKFKRLKSHLKDIHVIGYIYRGNFNIRNYYLTQYALAPVVVKNNPDLNLVIGNFGKCTRRFLKKSIWPKYEVIKNFGNGVLLLRKKKE